MVRITPAQRNDALRRAGTATMGIAAFAVGATGVATVLAWQNSHHTNTVSTTDSSVTGSRTDTSGASAVDGGPGTSGGQEQEPDDGLSLVPGGGVPQQAPGTAQPPAQGSGGGSVGTGGS